MKSFFNKKNENIYIYAIIIFLFIVNTIVCFFKYPRADSLLYLLETSKIASTFSNGGWIGNEPVGVHGFLFKIPVALLFMMFGNSIFIPSFFNVIIGSINGLLFYKIIKKYTNEEYSVIFGIALLVFNNIFIYFSSSYYREMPVLFSFLLLIYFISYYPDRKILIGLTILLLLDAKEHVFFQLMPGFFLWLIYMSFFKKNNKILSQKIKKFLFDGFLYFFPSLLYLFLMLFTNLIPLNTFCAYILGFVEKGFNPVFEQFTERGTYAGQENSYIKETFMYNIFNDFFNEDIKNSYLIKFFLPGITSLVSIPKIIIVPAFITSWYELFKKHNKFKDEMVLFFFLLWTYFLIYYFRASHGRYLFSILPIVIIFFIKFIESLKKDRKNKIILIVTYLTIAISLMFELNSFYLKMIFQHIFIILLIISALNVNNLLLRKRNTLIIFITFISLITFSNGIVAKYKYGEIFRYQIHGYAGENKKVFSNIDKGLNIATNADVKLAKFYRKEYSLDQEFGWKLQEWVPKKYFLKKYSEMTFSIIIDDDIIIFRKFLKEKGIDKIYFFYSTDERRLYNSQEKLDEIKSQKFFKIERVIDLKNKHVYIFNILQSKI